MATDDIDSPQSPRAPATTHTPISHRNGLHDFHDGADSGQATTEYALIMLGAALVALMVVTWATAGGGAGKIGQLFESVLDAVVRNVT
jgi:hypothetical protein